MTANIDLQNRFNEAMAAFVGNRFDESISILGEIIKLDPTHKLALTARGSAHLKRKDPRSAVSDFTRAIEIDSSYARAYHLRGLARESLGEDESALADFDSAVRIDPVYGAAYYSRAALCTKLGREDQAAEDMETVAHLTSANIAVFANENNVWQSEHLRVEDAMESELQR